MPNVKTTPLALDALVTEKAKHLFESNNVLSHVELEARHEIELEKYVKKVQIEARIMGELCTSHILPPAFKYQNTLIQNIIGMKEIGLKEPAFSNQKAHPGKDFRTYFRDQLPGEQDDRCQEKSQCADRYQGKGDCLLR